MKAPELVAQQFVAAVMRLANGGVSIGGAMPVPSFGDVDAAVRQHFKMVEADPKALFDAVRKAASANRSDALNRALTDLEAAHAQELVARQQTAFLIGMEVGRATRSTA
jgi:hypothetical protein